MMNVTATLSQSLNLAVASYKAGKLAETELICHQILNSQPDYFDAIHLLAVAQFRLGKKDAALETFNRALGLRPTSPEVLSNRGNTLKDLKRFDDALKSYDRAIALRPNLVEALYNRGNTFRALGRHENALESYDRALKVRPDYVEVHVNRGLALHELKRFEEALASYGYALAIRPNYAELHNNRGLTLHAQGRFNEALASYDKALMVPNFAEAHSNRGLTLHALNRFEEALASFDRALQARPDYVEALTNRGLSLHKLGRLDEALESHEQALFVQPLYAPALLNRGLTLQELRRPREALYSYDRALDALPDYAEAHNNRGIALHDLHRLEEALSAYDRALSLRSNYAAALSNRGNTLRELQRFEEALGSYNRALILDPTEAKTYNNLGVALKLLGKLSEAGQAFERAIDLDPHEVKFRCDLASIRRIKVKDANFLAMEQMAKDDVKMSADNKIELRFALAKAYEDIGQPLAAFAQWSEGNALKRQHVSYDEAATLGLFKRIRGIFTPEIIQAKSGAGNASKLPVLIIGMMRSGSTLIEQILASHPQVFGGGELRYFNTAVSGIRTTSFDRMGFPEVILNMTGQDLCDLGTRYVSEIGRLAPAATNITDKMPENFLLAGLIYLALPNAPIIHTIRDPVDTCLSCFSKLFAEGQNHTYDLAELGRYYRHYQALMAHWKRVLPRDRILDVHYEDVVADLEGQARRIITYCGLDWDPRCIAFYQTERPVLTASTAQVRQPIYSTAVGRWHAHEQALQPLIAQLTITGGTDIDTII